MRPTSGPGENGPPSSDDRPVVAIYRDRLFLATETYIPTQADALRRYRGHYVCMRRVGRREVPRDRMFVLNRGNVLERAGEVAFKMFGVSPPLERALREMRATVLHAHLGSDGAVALPLARRLRIPLVVTF